MQLRRFQLERYIAGELEGDERQEVERALATDDAAQAALADLEREQREFEAKIPYAAFRIEHERRKHKGPAARPAWWLGFGGMLAAAAVALVMVVSVDETNEGYVGLKGDGVALSFHVLGPGGTTTPGLTGQELRPGDTIQLSYDATGQTHGALFGVDGTGAVTVIWPEGEAMAPLTGNFDFSLTLDDTPGRERFVAVFGHSAQKLAPLHRAVTGDGEWPESLVTAETSVVKR
ncbi:MAG: hypothetical protein AAF654_00880 [Myxococcota bacterium]